MTFLTLSEVWGVALINRHRLQEGEGCLHLASTGVPAVWGDESTEDFVGVSIDIVSWMN